jgi:glycosyltransferase 2 family protein
MKTALLWLQRLFLVCSIAFLVTVFLQNRTDIVSIFALASYSGLATAILFWVLATLVMPAIAFTILRDRKNSITFRTLLSIHLNRIPSKFLPGGVWQTFARVYDMKNIGISKTDISLVVLYEGTYAIILGAIVSTLGIYLFSSNELYSTLASILFLGSIATIPLAHYFRKRSFILSITAYAQLTAVCTVFWVFSAGAFYSYMSAIGMVAASDGVFLTVVYYLFSFVVGFVSIFAPQGIGVFEVVYSELATSELPRTQLIIFVAGFRVLVMLSDMLTWLGYMLIKISGGVGGKQDAQ